MCDTEAVVKNKGELKRIYEVMSALIKTNTVKYYNWQRVMHLSIRHHTFHFDAYNVRDVYIYTCINIVLTSVNALHK